MSALRRKKGNILIAVLMFLISLGALVLIAFNPILDSKCLTSSCLPYPGMIDRIFGVSGFVTGEWKVHFDVLKNIKFQEADFFWLAVIAMPVITSFLALIFRRYRFFNALNFLTLGITVTALVFATTTAAIGHSDMVPNILNNADMFSKWYLIGIGCYGGSFVLSLINLELCR